MNGMHHPMHSYSISNFLAVQFFLSMGNKTLAVCIKGGKYQSTRWVKLNAFQPQTLKQGNSWEVSRTLELTHGMMERKSEDVERNNIEQNQEKGKKAWED